MPGTGTLSKIARHSPEPLRDQILQRCRLMLMAGHVVPGQKLPLRPLAEEFDTSLMPVRDALNRLVADGALELSSSRTIRVPMMSDERLHELHEIRRALECMAIEHATPVLPKTSIDRLVELMADMAAALNVEDFETYVTSHYSFHFTIYAAANRPTLLEMIDMLWLQVGPWFRQCIEQCNRLSGNPNEGHEAIVAALRARDVVGAKQALRKDLFLNIHYVSKGVFPDNED